MYCELWCEFKITNQLYYYYTLQTVQIDCLINTTIQSSAIDVQVVDQHMPYLSVNPLLFIRKQKPCTTYRSIFPQCQHPKCQCLIPKRHVLQSHVLNKNIWMEKRTVLNSYSRNIRTPGYWSLHRRVLSAVLNNSGGCCTSTFELWYGHHYWNTPITQEWAFPMILLSLSCYSSSWLLVCGLL